jgi:hypothetical protein
MEGFPTDRELSGKAISNEPVICALRKILQIKAARWI